MADIKINESLTGKGALNQHTPQTAQNAAENITSRISRLTCLMREMALLETEMSYREFKSCQSAIQQAVKQEASALKHQGNIHLATAGMRVVLLSLSIAGGVLKAATPPEADANSGTFNFERLAGSRFGEVLKNTLQSAKNLLLKLPHEKLPDFANALGEAANLPEKRLQAKITQANADIRKQEMLSQIKEQDKSRVRQALEELSQAYRSLAAAENESFRSR